MKNLRVSLFFFLILSIFLPIFIKGQSYYLHVIILSLLSSILCMGWVLLLRVGLFSLGQAAFLGLGAYTSALLVLHMNCSFWYAIILSGLSTAFVAFLLGFIILRLQGIYFAVCTFAFGEVLRLFYVNGPLLFGGVSGLPNIPKPDKFFGVSFDSKVSFYYLILTLTIFTAIIIYRIDHSRAGRIFRSIGNNQLLALSQGINLVKYKVLCFTVTCFFAGIAGSFLAHYSTYIDPSQFGIWESILIQIKSTVGGVGTVVSGPILGAMVMSIISEIFRGYTAALEPLFFGSFVIIVIFFIPGGLITISKIRSRWVALKNKTIIKWSENGK